MLFGTGRDVGAGSGDELAEDPARRPSDWGGWSPPTTRDGLDVVVFAGECRPPRSAEAEGACPGCPTLVRLSFEASVSDGSKNPRKWDMTLLK